MRAEATFTVSDFQPVELTPAPEAIATGLPVGVATMVKHFSGDVEGRSVTVFTAAFDPATGIGTYVAMESFAGTVGGAEGTFNFTHGATTAGAEPSDQSFAIVPESGTGALAGIRGTGGVDGDAHRITLDYELG